MAALALSAGVALSPTNAQDISSLEQNPFDPAGLPSVTGPPASRPEPQLSFGLLRRVELPPTLTEIPPQLLGDDVILAAPEGWVRVLPMSQGDGTVPAHDVTQVAAPPDFTAAVVADDGDFRVRPLHDGGLIAEWRCTRCARGWKRAWRLHPPGRRMTSPVIVGDLVIFAAADNRIYGVQRRNGHRRWVADTAGRATPPLTVWRAPDETPENLTAVLVAIDDGAELIAIDTRTGRTLGGLKSPGPQSRLRPGALALGDGRVAIVIEEYGGEAALGFYRLEPRTGTATAATSRPP